MATGDEADKDRQDTLAELVEWSSKLQNLSFPTLSRPSAASNEPATRDLVAWAGKMYCYSVLAALKEMLESFLFLETLNNFILHKVRVSSQL